MQSNNDAILDEKVLKRILQSFTSATGLWAILCDTNGLSTVTPGMELTEAPFCQIIKNTDQGKCRCARSYRTAGREAAKWGEPYIFRCHAGLVNWAAPILLDKEHVSTIICGQVLMWEPEDYFWDEVWNMTKNIGVDHTDLSRTAKELKVMSPQRVKSAADLLFIMANYLTQRGSIILEQRLAIQKQQAKIRMLMQERERVYLPIYSVQKERELLQKIKLGKVEQALNILDDILTDEFLTFINQHQLVRVRLQELLVLISRAVVQEGDDLPVLLKINLGHNQRLSDAKTYEELCFWAREALREYFNFRSERQKNDMQELLERVRKFIVEHYAEDLTVEEMASFVYLSPHYLCRVFKQRFGCTIIEYITQIRIEKAKKLLLSSQETVQEVGEKVGFNSPSYFNKVFKRTTGLTPLQFRRMGTTTYSMDI